MKKWFALGGGVLAAWVALLVVEGPAALDDGQQDSAQPASEAREADPETDPDPESETDPETDPEPARALTQPGKAAPPPMPPSGHFEAMRRAFDAESRDAEWAREQEARIPKLVAEVGFPSGAFDRDVTCRRTLCRFRLRVGDDDQFALMKLAAEVQTSQGLGLAHGAAEVVDGKSRVVVYTPREGTSLEDLPAK